ncbi:MAG: hypothetical protein KIS85_06665 [Anaerolineales bacterium]|nr:hypothetical protein [Anaerolineales bacterium]
MTTKHTKQCPYCGGEILAIAIKCKYCREFLSVPSKAIEDEKPPEISETSFRSSSAFAHYGTIALVVVAVAAVVLVLSSRGTSGNPVGNPPPTIRVATSTSQSVYSTPTLMPQVVSERRMLDADPMAMLTWQREKQITNPSHPDESWFQYKLSNLTSFHDFYFSTSGLRQDCTVNPPGVSTNTPGYVMTTYHSLKPKRSIAIYCMEGSSPSCLGIVVHPSREELNAYILPPSDFKVCT